MAFPSEVGLRVLLCPLGSNVIVRTACCSVGVALPVYSTFKAIESKDRDEQQRWLLYWAAYGSFSIAEVFSDKLISWVPLYYHMKFAFLVWLQLPSANGAKHLYMRHLRPFLLRHQARLDQVVEFLYTETIARASLIPESSYIAKPAASWLDDFLVWISPEAFGCCRKFTNATYCPPDDQSKFISSHQGELQFARDLFMKIVGSASGVVRQLAHPGQKQPNRAIRGPEEQSEDTGSDKDD